MPEIRIIHTSDFHGRLTPEKAARLRALKEEHGALLIDTGDAVCAPNVAVMPWRERAISLMNAAGYDAMGLGNREYFFRRRGMAWKTGHAAFPRLSQNLGDKRGVSAERRRLRLRRQGIRFGIIGFMPTMIQPGHWLEQFSDMRFIPWPEAARGAIEDLRGAADLIVALFHRPAADLEQLCAMLPNPGLVLAGHEHVLRPSLERSVSGHPVSCVGEGASHARLIGLNSVDGAVTMDRLVDLSEAGP